MDKRLLIGIVIIILVLFVIYMFLGSATPENMTPSNNIVKTNVSGIFL